MAANYLDQSGDLTSIGTPILVPIQTDAFTVDAGVSYEFPRKWGLATFRVANIFDRQYQFLTDPLALDPRIPERQIRFRLAVFF